MNAGNLHQSILDDIATAVNRVHYDISADQLIVDFNAEPTAAELTILDGDTTAPAGGLIASHPKSVIPKQSSPYPMSGDPSVNDDWTTGFWPGLHWCNTQAPREWRCDGSRKGAAVWTDMSE